MRLTQKPFASSLSSQKHAFLGTSGRKGESILLIHIPCYEGCQYHPDNAADFDVVSAWLEKWEGKVRAANYSTGGFEHIWDVEGPTEAIAELPEEWLCDSEWSNRR